MLKEGSLETKDLCQTLSNVFHISKATKKVEEQIWYDFGQKYIVHEFEEMDGCRTFCKPPLYHG